MGHFIDEDFPPSLALVTDETVRSPIVRITHDQRDVTFTPIPNIEFKDQ